VTRAIGIAAVAALAALAACKSPPPEYDGIGAWRVSRTRLKDATGNCQPTDLPDGRKGSYCFGQNPLKLGGSTAEVDLYFDGTAPDAKLIEAQYKVRGCREEPLLEALRKLFGSPTATQGPKVFWKNHYVFVAAIAPSTPGQCLVRVFPLAEKAEIERVQQASP
jgi:hypothetical protein